MDCLTNLLRFSRPLELPCLLFTLLLLHNLRLLQHIPPLLQRLPHLLLPLLDAGDPTPAALHPTPPVAEVLTFLSDLYSSWTPSERRQNLSIKDTPTPTIDNVQTATLLGGLGGSLRWCEDGTFKAAPGLWTQLYTIHGQKTDLRFIACLLCYQTSVRKRTSGFLHRLRLG